MYDRGFYQEERKYSKRKEDSKEGSFITGVPGVLHQLVLSIDGCMVRGWIDRICAGHVVVPKLSFSEIPQNLLDSFFFYGTYP